MSDIYSWNEGSLWGVLNDDLRVRLGVCEQGGGIWIGIDARLWDHRPDLASYTHDDYNRYQPEEIQITDDGLLTALHWHTTAQPVEFRSGFTVRMPLAFVVPLRAALVAVTERQSLKGSPGGEGASALFS